MAVFPGNPKSVSAGYGGLWSVFTANFHLRIDGIVIGTPAAVVYNNPAIEIILEFQMPSGCVFTLEKDLLNYNTYVCAFHGDMHATYAESSFPASGIGFLADIMAVAPSAISPDARAKLGDGSYEHLVALTHEGRIESS